MPCYHPQEAWRNTSGDVVFKSSQGVGSRFFVPCGQCVGCRLEKSRQWAVRILHETKLHANNCFITLTYSDDNLPPDSGLRRRHFQLFIKKLRSFLLRRCNSSRHPIGKRGRKLNRSCPDCGFRYFHCGEYGETTGRPHYHAILFGVDFPDKKEILQAPGKAPIFSSEILNERWGFGDCVIGAVTFESAAYVARYCVKKITGDAAQSITGDGVPGRYSSVDVETGEIVQVEPEYCTMSLKPGIGAMFYRKFESDFRTRDVCVVNGKESKIPRYYDLLFERKDSDAMERARIRRIRKASTRKEDSTPRRLLDREKVARANLNLKGGRK